MPSTIFRSLASLLLPAAILCATASANADITLRESLRVEGAGLMSMMNMSGTSTIQISGSRDRKSDQVCDFSLRVDQWIASDVPAAAEVLAYYQAYAEKMGFDASSSRGFVERSESLFGA
jgi:hypothetical protein